MRASNTAITPLATWPAISGHMPAVYATLVPEGVDLFNAQIENSLTYQDIVLAYDTPFYLNTVPEPNSLMVLVSALAILGISLVRRI